MAPSDDELVAFAGSMLAGLGEHLREPSMLAESVREQRHLWLMLFEVGLGVDQRDYGTAS